MLGLEITSTQLVHMKPDELANPNLKEEHKKIAEYKVHPPAWTACQCWRTRSVPMPFLGPGELVCEARNQFHPQS